MTLGYTPVRRVRLRIVLLAAALLLLLDGARSYYARVAFADPTDIWRPEASRYADLAWPPGADIAPNRTPAERMYARRCAVCHGPDGRGNGPAAPSLIPRPRDFTLGLFKYKSTLRSEQPTDADISAVITNGLSASAMPAFKDLISSDDIAILTNEVKRLAGFVDSAAAAGSAAGLPLSHPAAPRDEGSAGRGRALYGSLGCTGCHGTDGRKGGYLQDAKNYPTPVRDLTAPWTFRGGSGPEAVWMRLTTGLAGSSMPSYANATTPRDRWDLVNYLASIARTAPWDRGGHLDGPGQQRDLLRRGEYLVHAEMCGLCHTQIDRTGVYRDDRYLAGGMRVGAYPHAVFVSRNLTSDAETGLGRWTEDEIIEVFRSGRTPVRQLNFWGMPWFYPHYLTTDDARAIARYLKSQPPVRNPIPLPLRYGFIETVASKVRRGLPAASPTALTYADGNFARDPQRAAWPQRLLIDVQWVLIVVCAATFITSAGRGRGGRRRRIKRWAARIVTAVALTVCGVVLWAIYELPAVSIIPAEKIVEGATGGIVTPDPAHMTSEERALTARGEYLFKVASCAFCHGVKGDGGLKISWRPLGTLWVRNITPDRDTGIGGWTDAAIARAIRSGITPDDRVLHWQGMIWDHASNWDEEDIRAMISYLRRIPAVRHAIPPTRPPAADDCVTYTFWVTPSHAPGCEGRGPL